MFRISLMVLAVLSLPVAAQEKKKKTPFDDVPGYKVHFLAGFTVIVHEDVEKNTTSDMKRKPLECLELELKTVAGLMNDKAANALRKVAIWAEWNERLGVSNGRQGLSYASYYGGPQASLLGTGMHPLKAKCVTLHLTKELTKSYQEKDRPETLVMLHELAHAVHDQMLGMQHPGVKAAYQQAMARKLYDKSLYIATNEAEFFAESTCAYLDRLDYVPKNRAALKEHDPETFKLLETIWGKAAATKEVGKNTKPANGSGEFNMTIKTSDVKWGKAKSGEAFKLAKPESRVVLLAYTVGDQGAHLNRLRGWHEEYSAFGLAVVVVDASTYNPQATPIDAAAVPFTVHGPAFIPSKDGKDYQAEKPGHGILFSPEGDCLFRGPIDDATLYLKELMGGKIAKDLGLEEVPPQLNAAVEALKRGDSLMIVAQKAQSFTGSSDAAISETAKKIVNAIVEPGTKLLAEAVGLKKSDPLEAFLTAEKVTLRFKGLSVANKANALMDDLRGTQAVQVEMKARKDFEAVKKLETLLSSQAGAFEPKSRSFQAKNAASLRQLADAVALMRKKHPNARATQQAGLIAKEYGLE